MCQESMQTLTLFIKNVQAVDCYPCVSVGEAGDLQSYEEGVVDLRQHLFLVVDVLLLLEPDHIGDLHLLQGEEGPALLVLDQEHSAKGPRT